MAQDLIYVVFTILPRDPRTSNQGKSKMLETFVILLLVLWLLGMVTGQLFGNMLHLLLVLALVVFVVRLITGRRTV
jgi:hypothetical protein